MKSVYKQKLAHCFVSVAVEFSTRFRVAAVRLHVYTSGFMFHKHGSYSANGKLHTKRLCMVAAQSARAQSLTTHVTSRNFTAAVRKLYC